MVFIGYVLVYASTANGGKFATQPWMGILQDAYANANSNTSGGTGSSTGAPSTENQKSTKITSGRSTPTTTSSTPNNNPLGTFGKILSFFGGALP